MRTKFTLLTVMALAFFAVNAQQITNGGFESWTAGNPDNWSTWETTTGAPLGLSTKDTVTKVYGTASIKIKTDSVQAGPTKRLIPGFAFYGSTSYAPPVLTFYNTPFTFRPDTVVFLFKYAGAGNDSAYTDLEVSGTGGATLLYGTSVLPSTGANWYQAKFALTLAAGTPDSLGVYFTSSKPGTAGVAGSILNVDGLQFIYVTLPNSLQEIADKLNIKMYPNPATEAITISTDENVDGYTLTIIDVTGKLVAGQTLQGQSTTISMGEVANGTYIYRIADKSGNVLKQDRFNVVK